MAGAPEPRPDAAAAAEARREWTPDAAAASARAAGVAHLGNRHWKVITRCREEAARTGRALALGRVVELTDLAEEELRALFPGRPEISIARIAGLPSENHTLPGDDKR